MSLSEATHFGRHSGETALRRSPHFLPTRIFLSRWPSIRDRIISPKFVTVLLQSNFGSVNSVERWMSLEWRARPTSLAWSNPVAWWWGMLTLVSGVNMAVWFAMYRELQQQPVGS